MKKENRTMPETATAEPQNPAMLEWLSYPFINLSHVCRLLWGSSDRHITARLAYRRKNPASWTPEELEKLEEIRRSFAKQLEENQPVIFL